MKTSFARIVRNFSIAIALATVAPYASVASAEAVTCNKDANVAAANGLHLSDVTFGTSSSDDCWGVGPQNGQSESANPWYGGSWTPLVSDVGSNDTGYVGDSTNGMEFTLSRGASEWLLSWNDVGQLNALLTMDLVVVLAVKDHYASYLFSAEDFGGSSQRNGTFALRFSTAPLDHFAIYRPTTVALDARLAPQAIPEPAMLTLMGAGLIGLAVSRRRSRRPS